VSTGDRTRLGSPRWRLDDRGNFTMDLSWSDDSHRWLEVSRTPHVPHAWCLAIWEASDDSSTASHETLMTTVRDISALLVKVEASPWKYDRPPAPDIPWNDITLIDDDHNGQARS
jgi:hypothetical protein